MVIVIIEKMAKHDIVVRCWYFEFVLVLLDIIRGQLAKEDIMAFLHVKSVDCLFLPSLENEIKGDKSLVKTLFQTLNTKYIYIYIYIYYTHVT